jgi:hypothetical protein
MKRPVHSAIAFWLLIGSLIFAASGCAMFKPQPEPKQPLTVQDWIAQPRIQP